MNIYCFELNTTTDGIDPGGLSYDYIKVSDSRETLQSDTNLIDPKERKGFSIGGFTTGVFGTRDVLGTKESPIENPYEILAYTSTMFSGDDDVVTNKSNCCATINRAQEFNIFVVEENPDTEHPDVKAEFRGTDKFFADVIEHEDKRRSVYEKGYKAYLAPSGGLGSLVAGKYLCCGADQGGYSRTLLENYLRNLRDKAIEAMKAYVHTELDRIDSENPQPGKAPDQIEVGTPRSWFYNGIPNNKKVTVHDPPPFNPPQIPKCGNGSDDSEIKAPGRADFYIRKQ